MREDGSPAVLEQVRFFLFVVQDAKRSDTCSPWSEGKPLTRLFRSTNNGEFCRELSRGPGQCAVVRDMGHGLGLAFKGSNFGGRPFFCS